MHPSLNILLFAATLAGGSIPLWFRGLNDQRMHLLLSFSGSFLLGITLLHLIPESFDELGSRAGLYILIGFFVQLFIQSLTHGAEHGHTHIHADDNHIPLTSILTGLTLHAFMEGLPLGFQYRQESTEPSLYLAVAAHKLPEAMLVASLAMHSVSRQKAWLMVIGFSLITPVAGLLAYWLGTRYFAIAQTVSALIPVVAGAFLHIATTIFFESGSKQHHLSRKKIASIAVGVGIALLTLMLE